MGNKQGKDSTLNVQLVLKKESTVVYVFNQMLTIPSKTNARLLKMRSQENNAQNATS